MVHEESHMVQTTRCRNTYERTDDIGSYKATVRPNEKRIHRIIIVHLYSLARNGVSGRIRKSARRYIQTR